MSTGRRAPSRRHYRRWIAPVTTFLVGTGLAIHAWTNVSTRERIAELNTGLALMILGAILFVAAIAWLLQRRLKAFNEVFSDGYDLGHNRGYWEGRREARPVVVPLCCPHCGEMMTGARRQQSG